MQQLIVNIIKLSTILHVNCCYLKTIHNAHVSFVVINIFSIIL